LRLNEHRPAVDVGVAGADEPLNRHPRAVNGEPVPVRGGIDLAVAHAIGGALAIELDSALTEAEQRPRRQ
jgi:hypothetical protein